MLRHHELTILNLLISLMGLAVLRIHDILVWIRIRESMPLMDPDSDPAIFIIDLQDANKN
jgi:hypothetical protein